MKIFHGVSGAAGQPACIARAQNELKIGVEATTYMLGDNKFGYEAARNIPQSDDFEETIFSLLGDELLDYDVFHFYFRTFFFAPPKLAYPMGLDIALLRLLGKKVFLHFRGSEVRVHSAFKAASPYHYVDENPDEIVSKLPETFQRAYIDLAQSVCSGVFVTDPELQTYVPGSTIVPRAIDLTSWQSAPNSSQINRVCVVHAPSRQEVKGSRHIESAVKTLKAKGLDFDYIVVEGLPNSEAKRVYEKADIIVDQLRIGWYGVLAVEGMAMGKAVVSYVRDDLVHHLGNPAPIENANPVTIVEVLEKLILDDQYRNELGQRGYEYCCGLHDSKKVAAQLVSLYESVNAPVSDGVFAHFSHQFKTLSADNAEMLAALKSVTREKKILERKLFLANQNLEDIRKKLAPLFGLKRAARRIFGRL